MELFKGTFDSLNNYLNKTCANMDLLKASKNYYKNPTGLTQIDPVIFINYLKNKYL